MLTDLSTQWRLLGEVYLWCMSRTNIDIDGDACQAVMQRYQLATKREAVNFALRSVAGEH
jgi:Arc/MetJ family transcription regulator